MQNLNYSERLLLADILEISVEKTFVKKLELSKIQTREFEKKQKLLQKNYPLDYLLNKINFLENDFYLDQKVLIPRPETEEWVKILLDIKFSKNSILVDLGCGSGVVGLSLASKFKKTYGLDYSNFAIKVTKKNIKLNKIKNIKVLKSNLFSNSYLKNKINKTKNWVLTANLPYLPNNAIFEASLNKINFEPKLALYSGFDGLKLFRKTLQELSDFINLPNIVFFELDPRNIKKAQKLLQKINYQTQILKDFNQQNRLLIGFKNKKITKTLKKIKA